MPRGFGLILLLAGAACHPEVSFPDACGLRPGQAWEASADELEGWGSARDDIDGDGIIDLTPAEPSRAGSRFDLGHRWQLDGLEAHFEIYLGDGSHPADGVTFALLDADRREEANLDGFWLAGDGGCLGLGHTPDDATDNPDLWCDVVDRWLPGVAVEFDTWFNEGGDPVLNGAPVLPHGGLIVDGATFHALATWPLSGLTFGDWHDVVIDFSALALQVRVDGGVVAQVDHALEVNTWFHPGFTASTGSGFSHQAVRDWTLRGTCESVDPISENLP